MVCLAVLGKYVRVYEREADSGLSYKQPI